MKTSGVFILVLLAIIAGLGLGLLVGWVAWPVQWINASPENMRREFQIDWMNMSIDSYSINQNAQLAAQRFAYLGKDGPADLAYVVANPKWVSETDALAYASAVKQELGPEAVVQANAVENAPTLASRLLKQPLFGYVVVALFLALLAIVLLIILVIRLTRREKVEPAPVAAEAAIVAAETPANAEEVQPEGSGVTAGEVAAATAVAAVAASQEGTEASTGETEVAGEAEAAEEVVAEPVEEPEVIPAEEVAAVAAVEQAQPSAEADTGEPSNGRDGGVAKVMATGAAVAGIVSAMKGDEEKETEPVEEAPVAAVSAETQEEAPEPSNGKDLDVGKVLAAGAAAAGIAAVMKGSGEETETVPEEERPADAVAVAPNETFDSAIEDTRPVATAAAAGAAVAGVEWALENQPETEEAEQTPVLFPPSTEPAEEEWAPETVASEPGPDYLGKYNRKIIDIEGIGEAYAQRLEAVGITTTHAYLQKCSTREGREELAEETGISHKLILEWANHADMMRVQGIGPQWSDLLEMAGVNTVRELALRNPTNLHQKLEEINEQKKLVRKLPTLEQLDDWIEQSKDLPRILTY